MIRRFAALVLLAACAHAGPAYTYPDNSDLPASSFIDIGKAVAGLRPGSASRVTIRKAAGGRMLLRWSEVVTPRIALTAVAPGRMVYEITETYTHPFTMGPDRYRSGQKTTIVDAQTGTWIIASARGNLASRANRTR